MIKHPIFSQEIIENNLTEDNIDDREIYWISYYNSYWYDNPEFGLNLTKGGQGNHGYKHTLESRERMSELRKGKKQTFEFKKRMSENNPMKKPENIEKLKGINNPRYGLFGGDSPTSKKIRQYTIDGVFIKEYSSTIDASKELGINVSSIRNAANPEDRHKTAGGFVWRYYEKQL